MLRRKILKMLAAIPFVGIEPNEVKPAQSVVARAKCGCEGYVKHTVTANEHGWYVIPFSLCSKCKRDVTHEILEEDNPNLKNQIQRTKKCG